MKHITRGTGSIIFAFISSRHKGKYTIEVADSGIVFLQGGSAGSACPGEGRLVVIVREAQAHRFNPAAGRSLINDDLRRVY